MIKGRFIEILLKTGLLAAAFGGMAFATCSHRLSPQSSDNEVVVTNKDNGKTTAVVKGNVLVIRLESQPGTGYAWRIGKYEKDNLDFAGETTAQGSDLPGGIEYQVFRFKTLKAGSASAELEYVRSWEQDKPPVKTFKINLDIRAAE